MTFIKNTITLILVIAAVALLMPNTFISAKNWIGEKLIDKVEPKYEVINGVRDYGKIYGFFDCTEDIECQDAFKLGNLECSNGRCIDDDFIGDTDGE